MDPPPQPPTGPGTSAPSTVARLPSLEILDRSLPHKFIRPAKRINDGPDVPHFLTSHAYRDIGIFVMQLNRALCPRKLPASSEAPPQRRAAAPSTTGGPGRIFLLSSPRQDPGSVKQLQALLEKVAAIIDEVPPDPGPRRFGNISFRKWHVVLAERADALLAEHLPKAVFEFEGSPADAGDSVDSGDAEDGKATALDELKAYFLGGFGSEQRLDYGTGHELSFLAFLGGLWKLGGFSDGPQDDDGALERSVAMGVVEPYLQVIRRLILTYTLEPAGSHGVWGLDDHSFVPYILGSAQLTRPVAPDSIEPMPLEGSVLGAPKPSDVTKAAVVDDQRSQNMYFSAIGFINDVKKGPFWEHSPILFDVSGIKDGWGKINKGMIKMFNAEVLSKFPVVQHFPFGSLFSWEVDRNATQPAMTVHMVSQPAGPVGGGGAGAAPTVGTAAPWAQPGSLPSGHAVAHSRIPGAGTSGAPPTPRGGIPNTGPAPPSTFPQGRAGTTSAQHTATKAPWAR